MPIWLIGLLPKVLPFLKSKGTLIVGAVVLAGMAGWTVNGWRLDSKYADERADRQAAVAIALAQRDKEFRIKFMEDRAHAKARHDALMDDLDALRVRNSAIFAEIDARPLTKPLTKPLTGDPNAKMELQNPFSDDFVDIWNSAADRVRDD